MVEGAGELAEGLDLCGFSKLGFYPIKFAVGFDDLWDVRPFALEEEKHTGQAIEQFAGKYARRFFTRVKVFVQHEEVVAEIEKGFTRTLVG